MPELSPSLLDATDSALRTAILPVATRSALAGRSLRSVMAYLTEVGRQGYFYFSSANLSAEVAFDTTQAFYVAPSSDLTGASGAWVRAGIEDGLAVLTWFGASASNSDNTSAIVAAFAWAAAARGRKLQIPPAIFRFASDIRLLGSYYDVEGSGMSQSILRGTGGAKIYLGEITGTTGAKTGTKVQRINFRDWAVMPADNHIGSSLIIDYADYVRISSFAVGPANHNGVSGVAHGIELRWVQWFHADAVTAQINGHVFRIMLDKRTDQNEDHIKIENCNCTASKVAYDTGGGVLFRPAFIYIERDTARTVPLYQFAAENNHYIKNMDVASGSDANANPAFLLINNQATLDQKTISCGHLTENMCERADFIDCGTLTAGRDTSTFIANGNSFYACPTIFKGGDYTKQRVACGTNRAVNCTTIFDNIRAVFNGYFDHTGTSTISTISLARHRYSDKAANANIEGVRMEQASNSVAVASGATFVDVTHSISVQPNHLEVALRWNSTWWPSLETTTGFRINFGTAPGSNSTLDWKASVTGI